jgi:very-short-patch-repair endonuclease
MEIASKENNYHYNKQLQLLAKVNKKTMTKSAACMWKFVLGNKQMKGYQFRRERPILDFIVDFVCLELLLIVEVDGITHQNDEAIEKDTLRDQRLAEIGFNVLRFSSWEVLNQIDQVSILIGDWISKHAPESISLSKGDNCENSTPCPLKGDT